MTGSISGGIIVGKFRNIDIREKGSNNAGATNALRTMGKKVIIIGVSWTTSRRLSALVDGLIFYDIDVDQDSNNASNTYNAPPTRNNYSRQDVPDILQSIENGCGLQMDGFSAREVPYSFIFEDVHYFAHFGVVFDGLTLLPRGPWTS